MWSLFASSFISTIITLIKFKNDVFFSIHLMLWMQCTYNTVKLHSNCWRNFTSEAPVYCPLHFCMLDQVISKSHSPVCFRFLFFFFFSNFTSMAPLGFKSNPKAFLCFATVGNSWIIIAAVIEWPNKKRGQASMCYNSYSLYLQSVPENRL